MRIPTDAVVVKPTSHLTIVANIFSFHYYDYYIFIFKNDDLTFLCQFWELVCAVEHVVIIGLTNALGWAGTLYRAKPFMGNMMTARMMDSDNTDDPHFFVYYQNHQQKTLEYRCIGCNWMQFVTYNGETWRIIRCDSENADEKWIHSRMHVRSQKSELAGMHTITMQHNISQIIGIVLVIYRCSFWPTNFDVCVCEWIMFAKLQ